jgi:PAS domain S-box-containing protein
MKRETSIKLRWHLVVLIVATLVPMLIFAAILMRREINQQRESVDRGLRDTARALSLAVDREIASARAVLDALEGAPSLDEPNFPIFYRLATAAAAKRQGSRIILFALDGQQLVNTARPIGDALPNPFRDGQPQGRNPVYPDLAVGGNIHLKQIIERGQPSVSDVFITLTTRRPGLAIGVPVKRNNKILYILDITFELGAFTRLLLEEGLPAGSQGVIVDRQGVVVTHTTAAERFVGRRAAAPLLEQMAKVEEGVAITQSPADASTSLYYVRSKSTGWTTAIGVSQAAAKPALNQTIYLLIGGAALLLLVSLAAALFLGGRLTSSLARLAVSADAIQRGEPIELKRSAVHEIEELHRQLVQAGTLARQSFQDRTLRIEAEAQRTAAEESRNEILEREAKLQESEERLRAFLENSATIAWMVEEDGRYVYLSRNYLKHFDLDAQHWQGKTVCDLWPAAVAEKLRQKDLAVLAHGGLEEEIEQTKNPDGSRSWWFNSRFVLTDRSGKRYVGCLAVDITERKRLEDELEQRVAELKEADRRKDEFLAMLSHELRNPLAPIANAVQILKTLDAADPKLRWCRDLIDQQINLMSRLMEDLLDVSRITRGRLPLHRQSVELRAVVEDALQISRPLIEARGHKLTVDLPAQTLVLDGDPARLTQVFANLLNNAAKYMESSGEIRFTARLGMALNLLRFDELTGDSAKASEDEKPEGARVDAATTHEVVVSVKDTGIGLAPEKLPHIFDMFFQVDNGRERRYDGLGIGLTLARNLVELHGGRIEARSEGPGKGSEFIVRLPVARVVDVAAASEPGAAQRTLALPGNRIAVVDDNKMQAQSMAMLLELMGYQVQTAHDGESAIRMIAEFVPHVALIDIGLPGLNGYELARRLLGLPQLSGITLIAQTGWGRDEDRELSRQAGFQHHLIKPIDHQLLEKLLGEILGSTSPEAIILE